MFAAQGMLQQFCRNQSSPHSSGNAMHHPVRGVKNVAAQAV
jgi:hypothetical protein